MAFLYPPPHFIKTNFFTDEMIANEITNLSQVIMALDGHDISFHKNSPIFLSIGFVIGVAIKHVNTMQDKEKQTFLLSKLESMLDEILVLRNCLPNKNMSQEELHMICSFASHVEDDNLYKQLEKIVINKTID